MRHLVFLILGFLVTACTTVTPDYSSRASIQPSSNWYIVPEGESTWVYAEPALLSKLRLLSTLERYQIIGVDHDLGSYRIRTSTGDTFYIPVRPGAPVAYVPGVHPTAAELDKIDNERRTCGEFSSQASAQAAFEANSSGMSKLDADGDGIACEYFDRGWRASVPTYVPSVGTGDVHVRGHYRTTKSGKRVYVRPHHRSRRSRH